MPYRNSIRGIINLALGVNVHYVFQADQGQNMFAMNAQVALNRVMKAISL